MRRRWVFIAPAALLGMILFTALGGYIVQQLWNWLLPAIFSWKAITFWQAIGLLALCRILFGGLGLHGRGHSRFRERMAERCQVMTPEEREKFRESIREKWGSS